MTSRKRTAEETRLSAEHAERQRKALELRKVGASYDSIAQSLGYANRGGAYKAVSAAIADITAEPAEEVRKLELERLDHQWARVLDAQEWALQLNDGGALVKAVGVAMKVQERRARLLGLDAPARQDTTLTLARSSTDDLRARAVELARVLVKGDAHAVEEGQLEEGDRGEHRDGGSGGEAA